VKTIQQEIIVGLDLGSTMIRVAIGKRCEESIEIIGVGENPSQGMRKGIVINPGNTAAAIRKALNEAELMAGCTGKNVVVGISGVSILSQTSYAEVWVKQDKVSEQDVREGIWSATRSILLPPDREILHVIPIEFIIDKQTRTNLPSGMTGSTLEVKAHIVTVASASIRNIVKACKLAGLRELNIVLQSLATAETVLLPDELEQGVVLIDIGGGPAKIAVFSSGVLLNYNQSVSFGSQLTTDVAVGLRIPMLQAEQVKRLHGCCLESLIKSDDMIEIELLKDNSKQLIPCQHIVYIFGARMEEMFTLISRELQKSGYDGKLAAGAVITGGTSLLRGVDELASRVLNMPVRIDSPRSIEEVVDTISLPHHSTAVGLVLLGSRSDEVPQGIMVGGVNLWVLRATLAIRHLWSKFV
jgi:cell division protein FtsA